MIAVCFSRIVVLIKVLGIFDYWQDKIENLNYVERGNFHLSFLTVWWPFLPSGLHKLQFKCKMISHQYRKYHKNQSNYRYQLWNIHIQHPNKPADRGPRTDSVFFTLARVRFMKHWVCMTHVSACAKKTGARITRIKLGTPVKYQCYYHYHSYIFIWRAVQKQYECSKLFTGGPAPVIHFLFGLLSSFPPLKVLKSCFSLFMRDLFLPGFIPSLRLHSCQGRAACKDMPPLSAHTAWLNKRREEQHEEWAKGGCEQKDPRSVWLGFSCLGGRCVHFMSKHIRV